MRKIFSVLLHEEMEKNKDIVLITADLGYGLWDQIRDSYPDRFHNVGSSEQLMMGMAVGFTMEGKIPLVYSITPFLLYRPFEIVRNYINKEKLPVKLVGGGRNKDYGHLGFSHWAEDDKEIVGCFKNIMQHHPEAREDLEGIFDFFINNGSPQYLNLKRKL